jgi:hypothetical protein
MSVGTLVRREEGRILSLYQDSPEADRYERSESFLRGRRIEQIRQRYSDEEIANRLRRVMDEIQAYQDQFDAETLGQVSLQEADKETTIDTAGCNCLKISVTPGSRDSLQTYSRQYEDT